MNNELQHHGVLGMKWGVRHDDRAGSRSKKHANKHQERLEKQKKKDQKKFEKKVNTEWYKAYNDASNRMNSELISINERHKDDEPYNDDYSDKAGQKYIKEVNNTWQKLYADALVNRFGDSPIDNGRIWINNAPLMDMYVDFIISDKE